MRKRGRVDLNQNSIVKGLRQAGADVESLAALGDALPDLLVGFRGINYLFEVKNPRRRGKQRQLRENQKAWQESWNGSAHKIETLDEALKIINLV